MINIFYSTPETMVTQKKLYCEKKCDTSKSAELDVNTKKKLLSDHV
jgi:hypothetical protein